MTVALTQSALLCDPAADTALASLFSLQPAADDPAFLVVLAINRDDASGSSGQSAGALSGNGATIGLGTQFGPLSYQSFVFARDPETGSYINPLLGNLASVEIEAPAANFSNISISLFAAGQDPSASLSGGNPLAIIASPTLAYLGSATLANNLLAAGLPDGALAQSGTPPQAATPQSVAAAALSFVGDAWDDSGCWYLASQIAAEAGAGLPIQSIAAYMTGAASGEWFAAYDGPIASSSSWADMIVAGDIVVFKTASGGGHIATVVAGAGATAQVVDNCMFLDADGTIANAAATQGQICIAGPHAFSDELAGVDPASAVIYALDTPLVQAAFSGIGLGAAPTSLGGLIAATDPAGQPIVAYQVYDSFNGSILRDGVAIQAGAAADAVTIAAGEDWSVAASQAASAGALFVRAFNGHYWGDWLTLPVTSLQAGPAVFTLTAATASALDGLASGENGTLAALAARIDDGGTVAIADSAAAIADNLPGLTALAAAGHVATIHASDTAPTLSLSGAETTSFRAALSRLDTTSLAATIAVTGGASFLAPSGDFHFDLDALPACIVDGANGSESFTMASGTLTIFTGSASCAIDARQTGGISMASAVSATAAYDVTLGDADNTVALSGLTNHLQAGNGDNLIFLRQTAAGSAAIELGDGKNFVDFAGGGQLAAQLGGGGDAVLLEGAAQTADLLAGGALCLLADGDGDTVSASAASLTVYAMGGGALSLAAGQSGELTFFGGAGAATVLGGNSRSVLFGGASASHLVAGRGGNSVLVGNAPGSQIFGVADGDRLYAGTTGQTITAGAGNETLGGGSQETCVLGSGHDLVAVGAGSTIMAGSGSASIFLAGGGNVIDLSQAAPGREIDVIGFNPALDQWRLGAGEQASQGTGQGIASAFDLSDGSRIVFWAAPSS